MAYHQCRRHPPRNLLLLLRMMILWTRSTKTATAAAAAPIMMMKRARRCVVDVVVARNAEYKIVEAQLDLLIAAEVGNSLAAQHAIQNGNRSGCRPRK